MAPALRPTRVSRARIRPRKYLIVLTVLWGVSSFLFSLSNSPSASSSSSSSSPLLSPARVSLLDSAIHHRQIVDVRTLGNTSAVVDHWQHHPQVQRPSSTAHEHFNRTRLASLDSNSNFKVQDTSDPIEELPDWMKDYFHWHKQQLANLNETNWQDSRYLVMRCRSTDFKCGGAADRLGPIPVAVLLASKSDRILFISWERPCALTEFLVPAASLDWRIPAWLEGLLPFSKRPFVMQLFHATEQVQESRLLVDMLIQVNDHGEGYYNAHQPTTVSASNTTWRDDYRQVWNALFQPSPAVAARIAQTSRTMGLVPGHYIGLHIRARYLRDKSNQHAKLENAVRCAMQLLSKDDEPVLVSSDTANAATRAVSYGRLQNVTTTARAANAAQPTLHLDRGTDFLATAVTLEQIEEEAERPPSAYYDVFVDLLLLANSRCVVLHTGNFGRMARLLSYNASCWIHHGNTKC